MNQSMQTMYKATISRATSEDERDVDLTITDNSKPEEKKEGENLLPTICYKSKLYYSLKTLGFNFLKTICYRFTSCLCGMFVGVSFRIQKLY